MIKPPKRVNPAVLWGDIDDLGDLLGFRYDYCARAK